MAAGMASMASSMIDAAFFAYSDASATTDPIETNLSYEKPVWILGKLFQAEDDIQRLREDILSRLWFTYRRNFPPIGECGPTSDTGWGCMLRCGQMMLAQALMYYHLGRDWSWTGNEREETYMNILESFLDSCDGEYSIHNIAQMGVGEGKQIGEWFGPNTVSQVLRKLVLFDETSNICVHVAMDNTVVIDDIKTLCRSDQSTWVGFSVSKMEDDKPVILEDETLLKTVDNDTSLVQSDVQAAPVNESQNLLEPMLVSDMSQDEIIHTQELQHIPKDDNIPRVSQNSPVAATSDDAGLPSQTNSDKESQTLVAVASEPEDASTTTFGQSKSCDCSFKNDPISASPSNSNDMTSSSMGNSPNMWHPLILFIPLRLGLMEINPDYYPSLKAMLTLKQSLGVIGGKPNHAHFFIGFNGDKLIYLDPHTTQENVEVLPGYAIPDDTYHCTVPSFMEFSSLDPSLALGFYCETEEMFDEWTLAIKELVIDRDQRPMFEICEERPEHWPPFELPRKPLNPPHESLTAPSEVNDTTYDYGEEDQIFDSSGEYEII